MKIVKECFGKGMYRLTLWGAIAIRIELIRARRRSVPTETSIIHKLVRETWGQQPTACEVVIRGRTIIFTKEPAL
jgi:hypothetical protein